MHSTGERFDKPFESISNTTHTCCDSVTLPVLPKHLVNSDSGVVQQLQYESVAKTTARPQLTTELLLLQQQQQLLHGSVTAQWQPM